MLTAVFPMRFAASTALLALLLALACGPSRQGGGGTTAAQVDLPAEVDAENFGDTLRLYHSLSLDSPARPELRERLLAHLDGLSEPLLDGDDFDALVQHFGRMTDLLMPEDVGAGRVPPSYARVARAVVDAAEPRGDEARVLAGLRILRAIDEEDAELAEAYDEVVTWGRDARAQLPTAFERYSQLIAIWDEHARLAPAPEVLQTLAQLHVDRRDSVMESFREGPENMLRMGPLTTQVMRIAPLDVTAVYLRYGDVTSAITHLQAMGGSGETETRLIQILEQARGDDDVAADALVELAEAYREPRPDTGQGLCRAGLRRFGQDARFPTCLARLAADAADHDAAIAWYAEAIELAPDVRGLYDEALQRIDEFLARGLFDQDASRARGFARRAEHMLDERMRRWPDAAPPVARGRIQLLVGTAEMHAGHPSEAKEHFEASLASAETPDALLQLGLLEERTGDPREALRLYRRALDLTPNEDPGDALQRARILEHLGDAYRMAEEADQARRMYRQSLEAWERLQPMLQAGPGLARLQVRRGVLLDRLGEREPARRAFQEAMTAAPQMRETYATVLAHLVSAEAVDLELATEVFRQSMRQLTLQAEWKVYFALWVKAIAARAGGEVSADVEMVLREQADASGWSGRLAAFGIGDLPYGELLEAAGTEGEETEAHFYEGARRLADGDATGARQLFERVLATRMVGFYEYTMAQQLLRP